VLTKRIQTFERIDYREIELKIGDMLSMQIEIPSL
jgi:hypothetical protein